MLVKNALLLGRFLPLEEENETVKEEKGKNERNMRGEK